MPQFLCVVSCHSQDLTGCSALGWQRACSSAVGEAVYNASAGLRSARAKRRDKGGRTAPREGADHTAPRICVPGAQRW